MTRYELITSDEYIKTNIECSVKSGRPIKETRAELEQIFIGLKNELIEILTANKKEHE